MNLTCSKKGFQLMRCNMTLLHPFEADDHDPASSSQWLALERLDRGTLGCEIWEYDQGRGFVFIGEAGIGGTATAQHDWVNERSIPGICNG